MGLIAPFIVLIERKLLRPVWLVLLAAVVLVTGIGAHAGKPGKARKTSRDMEVAVNSPLVPGERWVRNKGGRRMVDAIIVSNSSDRAMAALRAHVERLGGTVNAGFSVVQGLSVTVPTQALAELDDRDDVVSISPNRTTRHTFSALETTTGATSANVRSYSSATNYNGLDGQGIGIAVLDSGVMAGHKHMDGGLLVANRVVRQVNMVGQGANLSRATNMAPGTLERDLYETSVNNNLASVPDGYGHGTHVAGIAAGKGGYRALDTTGIAPGASIIDVKVLGADGSGNAADVIAGLDWVLYNAKKYNIRIVNLSLSAGSTSSWVHDPLAQAARAVVASGIVVVTAAGNYGMASGKLTYGTIGSPGHDPSVITVGSSNMKLTPNRSDDVVNSFSSRGPSRGAQVLTTGERVVDNLLKPEFMNAIRKRR
jgi:subtilisin family serine protease